MITYLELASMAKQVKDADWITPERVDDYRVPQFKIPAVRKQKSLREDLSRVLAFIDLVKNVRTLTCTLIPISTRSSNMISICGNKDKASRLIRLMESIGLIEVYDATWLMGDHCRTYLYFYENEVKLKQYCEENFINIWVYTNVRHNDLKINFNNLNINNISLNISNNNLTYIDTNQIRFYSKLCLKKPDNYTCKEFEEYLEYWLFQNYPDLIYYQNIVDELNRKYYQDYPELSLKFVPTFKWRKGKKSVKKIGIRLTNSLCNVKKKKRKELLQKYNLNLEKDVKSSVPRITYLLNNGIWLNEDKDLYQMIIEEVGEDIKREDLKKLFMPCYFDEEKTITTHFLNGKKGILPNVREEINQKLVTLQKAVFKVIGKSFDSEIFYYESIIYLLTLKELLEQGYFTWLLYDCFYSRGEETQEEFESKVRAMVQANAEKIAEKLKI